MSIQRKNKGERINGKEMALRCPIILTFIVL